MQTIRDVLIRVAIENGNMKLGPVDTSAFEASIKSAMSSIRMPEMPAMPPVTVMPSQAAVSVAQQDVQATANRTVAEKKASPRLSPEMDDEFAKARSWLHEAKNSSQGIVPKLPDSLAAPTSKTSEQADTSKRDLTPPPIPIRPPRLPVYGEKPQSTRDVTLADIQETAKLTAANNASLRPPPIPMRSPVVPVGNSPATAAGAPQSTREVGLSDLQDTAKLTAKELAKLNTVLIQVRNDQTKISDGQSSVPRNEPPHVRTPPPLPQTPPPLPSGQAAPQSAVSSLAGEFAGLVSGIYLITKALTVWGDTLEGTRKLTHAWLQSMVNDTKRATARDTKSAVLESNNDISQVEHWINKAPFKRFQSQIPIERAREAGQRQVESNFDMTPGQQGERRSRDESLSSQRFQIAQNKDQSVHLTRKIDGYRSIMGNLFNEKDNIRKRLRGNLGAIEAAQTNINENPRATLFGVKAYDGEQVRMHKDLTTQAKEAQLKATRDILAVDQQLIQVGSQQITAEGQQRQLLEERFKITKQMQQAAYSAVRDEKRQINAGHEQYGAGSFGDQARERRLQAKHFRIESGSGETYTQREIQDAARFGNIANKSARRQAREAGERDGIEKEEANSVTLKEKEDHAEAINRETVPQEGKIESMIGDLAVDSDALADRIANAIKAAFPMEDFINGLETKLEGWKEEVRVRDISRGMVANAGLH